jgi:PGF-CTERM protein
MALPAPNAAGVTPATAGDAPGTGPPAAPAGHLGLDEAAVAREDTPCAGTVEEPADGTTVVSVQGARFGTEEGPKKTNARLVAFGPRGQVRWVHESADEVVWGYDVDPLENGNLFVVGTFREDGHGKTMLFEFDPRTQERVWTARLNVTDTHDADLLDDHRVAVAHMRGYDNATGENGDGLLIYNRTSDAVEASWRFDADGGYPAEGGGDYVEDWTHLNDVDHLGGDRYLLSPRNFDQVVVVNLSSGEVELRLGEDDDHGTLRRQHNPQYLEAADGSPTVLVADSDNDRVVEYERTGDGWERTWRLEGGDGLNWPRDADRLPNGNTLVVDSRNDRVLEVRPDGEAVWEVYAPWLVYDAERVRYGDEARGHDPPTIADRDATGAVPLENVRLFDDDAREACDEHLNSFDPGEIRSPTTGTDSNSTTPTEPDDEGVALPGFGVPAALVALVAVALLIGVRRGRID